MCETCRNKVLEAIHEEMRKAGDWLDHHIEMRDRGYGVSAEAQRTACAKEDQYNYLATLKTKIMEIK